MNGPTTWISGGFRWPAWWPGRTADPKPGAPSWASRSSSITGCWNRPRVLTPWICLAATAVAARAARDGQKPPRRVGPEDRGPGGPLGPRDHGLRPGCRPASTALEGAEFSTGPISTRELIRHRSRRPRGPRTRPRPRQRPSAVYLVAGWLAHSGGTVPAPRRARGRTTAAAWDGMPVADRAIENIAAIASSVAGSDPLAWGTAHLAERLREREPGPPSALPVRPMTRRTRPRPMSCSQPGADRSASWRHGDINRGWPPTWPCRAGPGPDGVRPWELPTSSTPSPRPSPRRATPGRLNGRASSFPGISSFPGVLTRWPSGRSPASRPDLART